MHKAAILMSVLSCAIAAPAMAGFVATTGNDSFTYTPVGVDTAALPAVGAAINVTNQPLATYTPDGPLDPQIVPGDISNFLFSLDLSVVLTPGPGVVRTSGTYSIYYDLGSDGSPDILVSAGNATLDLNTLGVPGSYLATGALTQVQGPANPAFADLAYGDNANIVLQGGLYTGQGLGGTIALVLSQDVVVPEPVSLGSLAAVSLMALRRRRD